MKDERPLGLGHVIHLSAEACAGENTSRVHSCVNSAKGGIDMGKAIKWEASLTTAKARAKKEKKLILMDFYNNL